MHYNVQFVNFEEKYLKADIEFEQPNAFTDNNFNYST